MVGPLNDFSTTLTTPKQDKNPLNISGGNSNLKLAFKPFHFEPPKEKTPEEILYENRTLAIKSVIEEDPETPKDVDTTKLANMIMQTGKETGVEPLVIACICKKETHFDQGKNVSSGKGIMQITSIVTEDMFQRFQLYEPKTKVLIEKYGSLEKAFQAKKKNPSINLGDFGEMLYKYKTPEKLYAALQKDAGLNLKCGAYLMKFHLASNNGDLRKSLEDYNATSDKHNYAKKVISYITNSKCLVKLNAYV